MADRAFDTTLVLLTLHHCATPAAVLEESVRVTRHRLVVTESVYRSRSERRWLDLLDGRFNGYRHGGRMSAALAFGRPEEWLALFAARGLRVAATRWIGWRLEPLVHHPLLFALDVSVTPLFGGCLLTRA